MAANLRRPNSAPLSGASNRTAALLAALLILQAIPPATAQPPTARPTASQDNPYNTGVSPALAILVVAIVSAFFLLGFFSIYIRRCTGDNSAVAPAAALAGMVGLGAGRSRRGAQRGLDSAVLGTFPTMVYSSVKGQKLGKESLECAVCLCEFEDDDILRLLPRCSHVFHRDCIDIWLASHVTCPVCRCNLAVPDEDQLPETDHVAIGVNEGVEVVIGEDRNAELADLVRIGSQRREAAVRSRSGSVRKMPASSRSTVDWATVMSTGGGDGGERFRLRLPEDLRREILLSGRLRRSASFAVFPSRGEGSSRRGYREGVVRGWRSLRIGRSGRWPFLGRSFSVSGRGESALSAEGSVSGSSKGVRVTPAPLDSANGNGGKHNGAVSSSSTALSPVFKV